MSENKFSEKDSLELISQMIQQTKQNIKLDSGNSFLYYGYSAVLISIIVFILCQFTENSIWYTLWLLMFLQSIILRIKERNNKPEAITYMDTAIGSTWKIIGSLFGLTTIAILIIGYVVGTYNFAIMLPLSLLYAAIGVSITGVITNIRILIYSSLIAFIFAIYMLIMLTIGENPTAIWNIYFGISFLIMMVIPGHILNKKSKEICSKN